MLRFHRLFYCTPYNCFRFRKPQAAQRELGWNEGTIGVFACVDVGTAARAPCFRKPQAAQRELGWNEGTIGVYATSACPQPREPRTPPARRSHTRQLNPASHIAPPPRPSRQNPRTNVHFSLFLTKSCRLCAGFDVGAAYHSNADAQPPGGTIQFVAQQNPHYSLK